MQSQRVGVFAAQQHARRAGKNREIEPAGPVVHRVLSDPDRHARNTREQPDRVTPREAPQPVLDGGRLRVELPPLSWNTIRLGGP